MKHICNISDFRLSSNASQGRRTHISGFGSSIECGEMRLHEKHLQAAAHRHCERSKRLRNTSVGHTEPVAASHPQLSAANNPQTEDLIPKKQTTAQ